jgi:hypothetical protein
MADDKTPIEAVREAAAPAIEAARTAAEIAGHEAAVAESETRIVVAEAQAKIVDAAAKIDPPAPAEEKDDPEEFDKWLNARLDGHEKSLSESHQSLAKEFRDRMDSLEARLFPPKPPEPEKQLTPEQSPVPAPKVEPEKIPDANAGDRARPKRRKI